MKIGLRFVSPTTFVLQRFIFSTVALSPVFLLSLRKVPRDSDTLGKLLVLSLINASTIIAVTAGLVEESSGLGAVLTYVQPLFVFCLAALFLEEGATSIRLLGTISGFAGIVVLFHGRSSSLTLNSAIVMISAAFLWAVTIVYYKKYMSQVDSLIASFFQTSLGIIPISMFGMVTNGFTFPRDIEYLYIILYASVGAMAVGSTIWLFLIKEEEATVIAGSSLVTPLVALLLGWLFLGENIRIESILGSALILAGVFLVNMRRRKNITCNASIHPDSKRHLWNSILRRDGAIQAKELT